MAISILVTAFASALICGLIISSRNYHIAYTGDALTGSAQKIHRQVVPRVGGIGIFLGLCIGTATLLNADSVLALELCVILACLLPIYITGLAEDLSKAISPSSRYIAAALSALLIANITGLRISYVDVWGVDSIIAIPAFGILLFVFCVASFSHALNLIDGQNGLCAGVACIICLALMWQSHQLGLTKPFALAGICAAANLGFLVFNYPFGKIFLGDAGAYVNGAVISVTTVMLVASSGSLSPWYAVLLLIYPIWETLFSMWRRIAGGKSFSEPDSLHLHSLYFKAMRSGNSIWSRSSAPALWLLCACCCVAASFVGESTALCLAFTIAFCLIYKWLYQRALVASGSGA